MLILIFWEQTVDLASESSADTIVIGMAVSFLTAIEAKMTNSVELAGLKATIEFLQTLLGEGVSVTSDIANRSSVTESHTP